MEVVEGMLREGEWPKGFNGHELIGAALCVSCGHVVVFSHRGDMFVVWCPGFGLHRRVVASGN